MFAFFQRNGTSQDVTTIFTGEDDIRKLSLMDRFNGEEKMNYWSTDECNRLDGSDGSQFPPHWMDKKQPLQVFIKSFCRKFPLTYDEEVNILNGIPALRYKAPLNVFSHPNENAENLCYCNIATNDCPPSGLFNASLCFDGAPIFSSFPHFFTGDPVLFENIEGLQPDEKKHLTYADIHPRLAFPIDGASRFQINVQVQKADWVTGKIDLICSFVSVHSKITFCRIVRFKRRALFTDSVDGSDIGRVARRTAYSDLSFNI